LPPIPKCTGQPSIRPGDVKPGVTVHLAGASHCRAFVVTSDLKVDPVTGHEVYQMMEIGDTAVVEGAEPPFTGVVLTLEKNASRTWHLAP
jgi:hypothetical protein